MVVVPDSVAAADSVAEVCSNEMVFTLFVTVVGQAIPHADHLCWRHDGL